MWISRDAFERELDKARSEARLTERAYDEVCVQRAALQAHVDWLRIRVNQLEHERAALLFKNYDLKVPVPMVEYQPVPPSTKDYTATPSFDDVGDEEAEKLGITYAPDGTLLYSERNRYSSK